MPTLIVVNNAKEWPFDIPGVEVVSARRYLEQLTASGKAEVTPRYGAAGRPENRYRWLARG